MTRDLAEESGMFRIGSGWACPTFGARPQYASDLVVELLDWTKHSNLHIPIRGCVFHHELNKFIPFQTVTGGLDVSGIHYHFPNKNQCLRSYQSNLSFMTTNRNTAMQSMQTLILVSLPCLSNSRSPLSKHHSQMRCFERYKTGQESLTLAENRKILTDPLLYYEC